MLALHRVTALVVLLTCVGAANAPAASRRKCKRLCSEAISTCRSSGGSKGKCTRQLVKACRRRGPVVCGVSTGGGGGCDPYRFSCAATGALEFEGSGGRYCASVKADSFHVKGENEGTRETTIRMSVNADGTYTLRLWLSGFLLSVIDGVPSTDGGQVVFEDTTPMAIPGCAGGCRQQCDLRTRLRNRYVVERVCGVNEQITGSLEIDYQLTDGSICQKRATFWLLRDR